MRRLANALAAAADPIAGISLDEIAAAAAANPITVAVASVDRVVSARASQEIRAQ